VAYLYCYYELSAVLCTCILIMVDVDKEDCVSEMKAAKQREQELIRQISDNEAAFCQQRAKFMELFRQKEGEFLTTLSACSSY